MEQNQILCILLFISWCILLYQHYRWNNIEEMMEKDINKLLKDKWDDNYKQLIEAYGSTEEFIEAHYKDYDIFRSNVLVFIARLEKLKDGLIKVFDYLDKDIDKDCNTDAVKIKLDAVKSSVIPALDNLIEDTKNFVEGEEEAHSFDRNVSIVLEKLNKEIKDINFYDTKED